MKHLIDIVKSFGSCHAITEYGDELKKARTFESECVDGRFAVLNGVLFDLTQYDDRFVITVARCENGFDATADLSESLTAEAFLCAAVLDYAISADALFLDLLRAQL